MLRRGLAAALLIVHIVIVKSALLDQTLYFKRQGKHNVIKAVQRDPSYGKSAAATPPMGWITGERYDCNIDCANYPDDCVSEKLIKATAQAMVDKGLHTAGYQYVTLGDCWANKTRDSQGHLSADAKRFPSGMKSLADYVHSKGLKIGLYLDVGNGSCNGYPGSKGHKEADATTMAGWGIDQVTLDYCYAADSQAMDQAFPEMAENLKKSGREILLSCNWPLHQIKIGSQPNYALISKTCNTFKTYPDIPDDWVDLLALVKHFAEAAKPLVNYTGPAKAWNEVSQAMVGNYGLSGDQVEMQMGLLAILAAPIMMSTNVAALNANDLGLLLNKDLLAISQDKLGAMGSQFVFDGQVRYWLKKLSHPEGSFALALTYENISGGPSKASKKLEELGLTTASAYNFTDVFSGEFLGTYKPWHTFDCEVNPTGIRLIKALAIL